jgi:2-methylcitrate dehydratase
MAPSDRREGFMDVTTEHLSDYTHRLSYSDLPPEAIHQIKRTLADTLGCAAGAFDGEPAVIAKRMASRIKGEPSARILGTSQRTSIDFAAFANTVLVRYLDCNDRVLAEVWNLDKATTLDGLLESLQHSG